jgi:hypothetical protein
MRVAAASRRLPDSVFIHLDKFEFTKQTYLGRGGFAQVHRATYGDRQVAVKVLDLSYDLSAAVQFVSFFLFLDEPLGFYRVWCRSCVERSWCGSI